MGDEPNKSNPVIGVPDSQGMTLSRLGLWNDYVSRLRESSIAHRFATCDRTLFWISVEQLVGQDELSVAQLKRFVRLFRAKFAIELALKHSARFREHHRFHLVGRKSCLADVVSFPKRDRKPKFWLVIDHVDKIQVSR